MQRPRQRGKSASGLQPVRTSLQRAYRIYGQPDRQILLLPRHLPGSLHSVADMSKKAKAKAFEKWWQELPPTDVVVFSDGSQIEGRTGSGYVIYQNQHTLQCDSGRLVPSEVFDAEAEEALAGLKGAFRLGLQRYPIHICLKNTSVVACFRGNPADSSQKAFIQFQAQARKARIMVHWVSGHTAGRQPGFDTYGLTSALIGPRPRRWTR